MSKADRFAELLKDRPQFNTPRAEFDGNNNGDAFVNDHGDLRISRQRSFNKEQALALAAWIIDTFGGDE